MIQKMLGIGGNTGGSIISADKVSFDPTATDLEATDVQDAIEEVNALSIYSTNETICGYFIDSGVMRPIYRKMFKTTTPSIGNSTYPSNQNAKNIQLDVEVEKYLFLFANVFANHASFFSGNALQNTEYITLWGRDNTHATNPNTIAMTCGSDWTDRDVWITIEYLKA